MKNRILILITLIMTLFIGINVEAASKYEIGNCAYSDNKVVYIYSNGDVEVNYAGLNPTIADTYKDSMYRRGECYDYMYLNKTGRNHLIFSSTRNESLGSEEYYLLTKHGVNCYYDLGIGNDEYARIYIYVKENGSRFFISSLSGKNQYSSIDLEKTNTINTYTAKESGNVITYNLSNASTRTLGFADFSSNNTIPGIYNSLKGSACPTLYYKVYDDGAISVTNDPPDNDAGKGYVVADSNNRYNTDDGNGNISENTDENASQSITDVSCSTQIETTIDSKTLITPGKVSFDFKLTRTNGEFQFCVKGETAYSCTEGTNGYRNSLSVKNTQLYDGLIYFALDSDMKEYIENNKDNFTCPSYLGIYYFNNGVPETSRFMITTDQGKVSSQSPVSQIGPNDPGSTEYTCEGLIGENVLNFLTVIFGLIRIVGPILALVLGMYDLFMAMVNGEDDAKKKALKKLKGRIIAAVLLLILPYILDILLHLVDKAGTNCIPH